MNLLIGLLILFGPSLFLLLLAKAKRREGSLVAVADVQPREEPFDVIEL